jgi:non-ribosomal peptide synthetase component F
VLGGESLDVSSLRPWFERHGDDGPHVINMFGITETTVHVTYRRILQADVEAGAGSVIGVPIADLDVYVLDPHQRLVPVGVTGEIYVGGAGVARGYLDRAKTRHASCDPVGGTSLRLYRSGDPGGGPRAATRIPRRIDDQPKIRAPNRAGRSRRGTPVSGVRSATVWPGTGGRREQRLASYVCWSPVRRSTMRLFAQSSCPAL